MIRHLLFVMALLGIGSQIVVAQPATDNAPKAANPNNTDVNVQVQQQLAQVMRMTPEQRQEMIRKAQEQMLRMNLANAGFTDVKLQDTIVAFVAEQDKSRETVQKAAAKVRFALMARGAIDNTALTALFNDYQAAVDEAKVARETATKALDKEIHFAENTQLMALLTLNGLIGDATFFTGNVSMMGMAGMMAGMMGAGATTLMVPNAAARAAN